MMDKGRHIDPQEEISKIHDLLERSIMKVCKMEDKTSKSIAIAHDAIGDINDALLMLDGLRFAVRRGVWVD